MESNNWTKRGNEYNYALGEEAVLELKQTEHLKTLGRVLEERISKYPDSLTDTDWALWAICRPLLVGNGRFMRHGGK